MAERSPRSFWLNRPRRASQVVLVVKNPPVSAGDTGDYSSIPGSGRSPGEGKGNPLQYSCLENSTERRTWRQKSLVGYCLWGNKESDRTKQLTTQVWAGPRICRSYVMLVWGHLFENQGVDVRMMNVKNFNEMENC